MVLEILLRSTFFFFLTNLKIFFDLKKIAKKKLKNLKHMKNLHGTWGLDRF